MGFRFAKVSNPKSLFSSNKDAPKGYLAIYAGDVNKRKRFVIPVSYLSQPLFQELLIRAEEEFGFDHPMGGLMIPCSEDAFVDLISCLKSSC